MGTTKQFAWTCPVCDQPKTMTSAGLLRSHRRYTAGFRESTPCPGSGQRPDDPVLVERGPIALRAMKAAERLAYTLADIEKARLTIAKLEGTLPDLREKAKASGAALAAWDCAYAAKLEAMP